MRRAGRRARVTRGEIPRDVTGIPGAAPFPALLRSPLAVPRYRWAPRCGTRRRRRVEDAERAGRGGGFGRGAPLARLGRPGAGRGGGRERPRAGRPRSTPDVGQHPAALSKCCRGAESLPPLGRQRPAMARSAPPAVPPPPPGPPPRGSLGLHRAFLRSPLGPLRLGQLAVGAAFWLTVAAHRYEGAAHFALFAAVLVWLLTLGLFGMSALGRWELVPWLGSRWLLANLAHDLLLGVGLCAAAAGIMGHKAGQKSYCNLPGYSQRCLYGAYLGAAVCGAVAACLYLFSGLYCLARRCRDQRDIV